MTAKPCSICGAVLDGWIYDHNVSISKYSELELHTVGRQCKSCGAVVCDIKHNKQLGYSQFSGLNKVICPACGQSFGPPNVISDREIRGVTPIDKPSTNLETWANVFIDTHNGEKLLSATIFDNPEPNFKLILTDRRLIYLLPAGSSNIGGDARLNQDNFFKVIPLRRIASVKYQKTFTGAISLVIETEKGENLKLSSKGPLDSFAQRIQEAVLNAPPAMIFPPEEKVFYDGDNLGFLWTHHVSNRFGAEVHNKRFFATLSAGLAVTNCRMLFYKITHVAQMESNITGVSATLGEPQLQFLSIPWEVIRRITIDTSFMSKSVNLVLATPVWAFMKRGLHVYPDHEISVQELQHNCAKCGGTITGGVGMQRKDARGIAIETAQTGWHCLYCKTSYHIDKKCLPSKDKCPTCKKPMQAIDRSYPKVILNGQAQAEAPYLAAQMPPVPPLGVMGTEWNLPIMSDLKGWEEQVLPAVRMARSSLTVGGKGTK